MGKKGTIAHEGRVNPDPRYPQEGITPHGGAGSRPNNERMTYQKENFVGNPIATMGDGRKIDVSGTGVIENRMHPAKKIGNGEDRSPGIPATRIDGETPTRELND